MQFSKRNSGMFWQIELLPISGTVALVTQADSRIHSFKSIYIILRIGNDLDLTLTDRAFRQVPQFLQLCPS